MSTLDLTAWFWRVDQLLWQTQAYWRFQPMQAVTPPWQHATLWAHLAQLELSDCITIDQDQRLQQQHFQHFFPEIWQLPAVDTIEIDRKTAPFWLGQGIAGRKWQQIELFGSAVAQSELPVLEWCAGKGYLGRWLAYQQGCQVHSIEWQQSLCQDGERAAQQWQLPHTFTQRDVLKDDCRDLFRPRQQVLALHACGDLHRSALVLATQAGCQQLHLLPCCYHLQQQTLYQPLSTVTANSRLQLNKAELKLAVQGHATGGQRIQRLSHLEMLWRRAYQLWRTALTDDDQYHPLPSVPKQWFSGDFLDFALWAATQHGVTLPSDNDGSTYLLKAEQALLQQRRLELVQHLFRRPLELWLVLDRAIFLQEQGYQVQLRQLCDTQITPRNLLISAWRQVDSNSDAT